MIFILTYHFYLFTSVKPHTRKNVKFSDSELNNCEKSPVYLRKKMQKSFKGNSRMVKRIRNLESEDLGLIPSSVILLLCDLDNPFVNAIFSSVNENHLFSYLLERVNVRLN